MTNNITLTFGGTEYVVLCQGVQISWENNLVAKPKANGGEVVEVQTQGFNNPIYTLLGVELLETSVISGSSQLTYPVLLEMARNKYDGVTNHILLSVNYGKVSDKWLVKSDGVTPVVPVVIKSFSPKIGLEYINDGSSSYYNMGKFNIVLMETAG